MRSQHPALVALLLDSVAGAATLRRSTEDASSTIKEPSALERRADSSSSSTSIPSAISVAPSQYWDGNDGPWSSFALQAGTPKQNLRVMISTASFATWTVTQSGCPTGTIVGCEDSRGKTFLTNESLTWVPNSIWDLGIEINLGLDADAYFGFDTLTLGWQGSGLPSANHMVISNYAVDTYWNGVFGLNPQPTNFSNYNDPQPSFMTSLFDNDTIPSLAWSYTAGNQYRFSGDEYGSLVLGGYDQSKFTPTNVTVPFGSDVSRDLLIGVQSITTNASSTSLTSSSGGFYAFLDSTLAYLWLPVSVCEAFEDAFGLEWNSDKELYLVNNTLHEKLLAQNAEVTFTLGESSSGGQTVDIVFPYAAFDLEVSYPIEANKTRYFPLKQAANSTQYTLGRAFFQEAYVIADYERRNFTVAPCKWTENAASDVQSIISPNKYADALKSTSGSGGIGGGAIAGIVIGVIALLAIIGAAVWFFQRKRRGERMRIAELDAKSGGASADGNDSSSNSLNNGTVRDGDSTKPMISRPIGGELGTDSEIHEMQGTHTKPPLSEMDTSGQGGHGSYDPYATGAHKYYGDGSVSAGGFGTMQSGISEVEGNNEPIYEMMGSEVQEMPVPRRQSWADGDDGVGPVPITLPPRNRPAPPPSYFQDEKTGLH